MALNGKGFELEDHIQDQVKCLAILAKYEGKQSSYANKCVVNMNSLSCVYDEFGLTFGHTFPVSRSALLVDGTENPAKF